MLSPLREGEDRLMSSIAMLCRKAGVLSFV